MKKEIKPWFDNKYGKHKTKYNDPILEKEKKKGLKVWTDKQGNKLTAKEFMERWRQGIEGLTPLQVTKTHLRSLKVALIGILLGLYYSVMAFKQLYWLFVILLGSLGIMLSQWVAIWQKKKALEEIEGRFKQ